MIRFFFLNKIFSNVKYFQMFGCHVKLFKQITKTDSSNIRVVGAEGL